MDQIHLGETVHSEMTQRFQKSLEEKKEFGDALSNLFSVHFLP